MSDHTALEIARKIVEAGDALVASNAEIRTMARAVIECEAQGKRIAELEGALKPFVALFEASRERHMKRSAAAVAAGRIWFDDMPGDWIFETAGLTMADFRRARAALAEGK